MAQQYNAPPTTPSTIGYQIRTSYWERKALVEIAKEQYFSQLASVTDMPKNHGKKIEVYHYVPLLDDANLNDQGIDAAGVVISTDTYQVSLPNLVEIYAVEADATAAANAANAIQGGFAVKTGAVTPWTVTFDSTILPYSTLVLADALVAAVDGSYHIRGSGNLYGSSKDIGLIPDKLPMVSETGGRVNRVGFSRKHLTGTFEKFGFFHEYTQASLDFDTDDQLMEHLNRETLNGANEMTEDALQVDLLNAAGTVRYSGNATSKASIDAADVVTYDTIMRLSLDLDKTRTAKHTKIITGSRYTDTRTVYGCRVMYIGAELVPLLKAMKDYHDEPAFIPSHKYADAGEILRGEIGSIDQFRIIQVPEMLKWAGVGATASDATFHATNGKYDVFPMLVVGNESFTTIGFQSNGKDQKFKIIHKKPGEATADRNDPYGELGFMSIKWFYGFLAWRPERIGLIYTSAKL